MPLALQAAGWAAQARRNVCNAWPASMPLPTPRGRCQRRKRASCALQPGTQARQAHLEDAKCALRDGTARTAETSKNTRRSISSATSAPKGTSQLSRRCKPVLNARVGNTKKKLERLYARTASLVCTALRLSQPILIAKIPHADSARRGRRSPARGSQTAQSAHVRSSPPTQGRVSAHRVLLVPTARRNPVAPLRSTPVCRAKLEKLQVALPHPSAKTVPRDSTLTPLECQPACCATQASAALALRRWGRTAHLKLIRALHAPLANISRTLGKRDVSNAGVGNSSTAQAPARA